MAEPVTHLVHQARRELRLLQRGLADLIGVSMRTVQRHSDTGGLSSPLHYARLVQALHPKNPILAAQIAAGIGQTLPQLGVKVGPDALPLQPAAPLHVEAVICAAADALDLSPRAVRPVVAAIFARIRELRVDPHSLTKLLAETAGKPVAPRPGASE